MTQQVRASERERRAHVDPALGQVHGSDAVAGGGNAGEDYDCDGAAGGTEAGVDDEPRHPLPRSAEARPDQIPEREEREKGFGEDIEAKVQAKAVAVDPDGRPYPSGQSDR